jgi:thiol:disulfide interchange protein DsbD
MLASCVVRRSFTPLLLALIALCGTAHAVPGPNKVRLTLELDTPDAARGGETGLTVWAEIEPGWHINAHKPTEPFLVPSDVKFTLPPGIAVDTLNYPKPDRKMFAFAAGKELLVYEGKVGMTTAVTVPADFAGTRIRIEATMRYQACNDSTCLPPTTVTTELLVPVIAALATPAAKSPPAAPAASAGVGVDVGLWIANRGLAVTLLLVMLLGLGLNLTPCVYPLISVTVAYFGRQGHHHRVRVLALAALYVLGITISFSIVGVAAALSGGIFGAALQRPPVLIFIAGVLIALALSSFGLYQLQPPASVMRRVSGSTQGAAGALFMGLTMGVVAAPCVGPIVLGLLVFVGSQRSVWLGFELFFALGLGMGLPYLALALAAGSIKALPRSGEWLLWIERVFGFMLLGLAAYFVAPLLPLLLKRLLLPALIFVAGIYLGFIDQSGRRLPHFRSIQRLTGLVAVLIAVWLAVPQRAESAIRWQPYEPASLETAQAARRPAVIDFVADWCIPCHEMERTTFSDADVRQQAERFAMLKADITREDEATTALAEQYQVRGVPTVIFVDSSGTEVHRLVGYVAPDEMLAAMRAVN